MTTYVIRRLISSIAVLFLVSIIAFVGLRLAPGNAFIARMSPDALASMTPSQIHQAEQALGLNDPMPVQYWHWLDSTLHGSLGVSSADAIPVTTDIRQHATPSLILMGVALAFGLLTAIPLGIVAAVKRKTVLDYMLSTLPVVAIGIPGFVLSLAVIYVFAVHLQWFPTSGMHTPGDNSFGDLVRHLILPALVLSIGFAAPILRYTRASMIDSLSAEYTVTARAKGLRRITIIGTHSFRNALLPLITVIGLAIPDVVAGAVITETIFDWPGMGQLAVHAANSRDTSVVLGIVLLVAIVVIFANLLADIAYAKADPRVRLD